MEALRQKGVDARLFVAEKITDSRFVELAASKWIIKLAFLLERLKIFISNGFNKNTLFKIDTGDTGLPLYKKDFIRNADAILLNWVNQGVLSLKGLDKILKLGKPVVWTMHDMWNMTGICHHAFECKHYVRDCGDCYLLGRCKGHKDLSRQVWGKKDQVYKTAEGRKIKFVAVSNWLKDKALASGLLGGTDVEVIPNPFHVDRKPIEKTHRYMGNQTKTVILFGAARLDDPIKGLHILKLATQIIRKDYPHIVSKLKLVMFGGIKDAHSLDGFQIPIEYVGMIRGEESLKELYRQGDILVSSSSYETLPGTLVEAQAYGLIPISFNRGGQKDIIEHLDSGFLAEFDEDEDKRAHNLVDGIVWALGILKNEQKHRALQDQMRESVENKFSYGIIADKYISLIEKLS